MTINQMRFIDRYAGLFVCILLTLFDKCFLKIFRIFKKPPVYRCDKILFIKFWGMGSILLAAPVISAVRRRYPAARIYFLTFSQNLEICESLGMIDETITVSPSSLPRFIFTTFNALMYLRSLRLDVGIDLEFLARFSSVMSYLAGTRRSAEFHSDLIWRGSFSRIKVNFNYYFHVTKNFLHLVEFLDIKEGPRELVKPVVTAGSRKRIKHILENSGIYNNELLVGININSSNMAFERRWPKEHFARLANNLLRDYDLRIILIGSKADRAYVELFLPLIQNNKMVVNLVAQTSTKELISLLERCSIFVSNDSGPLHIAEALGLPTVSFFGPETPILYGPREEKHLVYYKNLLCSPCMNIHNNKVVNCARDNMCMDTISPDDVYAEMIKKYSYILDAHRL